MNWQKWFSELGDLGGTIFEKTIEEKRKTVVEWAGSLGFFPENKDIEKLQKMLRKVEFEQQAALVLGFIDGVRLLAQSLVQEKINKIDEEIGEK